MLIENLSFPMDRRMYQQALALCPTFVDIRTKFVAHAEKMLALAGHKNAKKCQDGAAQVHGKPP